MACEHSVDTVSIVLLWGQLYFSSRLLATLYLFANKFKNFHLRFDNFYAVLFVIKFTSHERSSHELRCWVPTEFLAVLLAWIFFQKICYLLDMLWISKHYFSPMTELYSLQILSLGSHHQRCVASFFDRGRSAWPPFNYLERSSPDFNSTEWLAVPLPSTYFVALHSGMMNQFA